MSSSICYLLTSTTTGVITGAVDAWIKWTNHGVLNLGQMYMFNPLALFYIMVQFISIIYDNSTTARDIP